MFDEYGNWVPNAGNQFSTPMFQGNNWAGLGNPVASPALNMNLAAPSMGAMGYNMDTMNMGGAASNAATSPGFWSMDNLLGKPGQQGMGSLALGAASGLMNGFIGLQQLGVAKDTMKQNKRQFDLNFGAQQKMTNSRLADRQATRNASGLTNVSVADYMKQYGI